MPINRRDLLKSLAAFPIVVSVPFSVEQFVALPDNAVLLYLIKVRGDILDKIIYPPKIMYEDGRIETLEQPSLADALTHVNALIKELS